MNLLEAIGARHTVREFSDKKLDGEVLQDLKDAVDEVNQASGLHIQLCLNEPKAFSGMIVSHMAKNAENYLGIVGKDNENLAENGGYYGEKLVLRAQQLGLNTHWVAMYNEKKVREHLQIASDEKLLIVIAVGYGLNQGQAHKSKSLNQLGVSLNGTMPDWFEKALKAVQLAPSALNRQDFYFELKGNEVKAKAGAGAGVTGSINLGIAKCHFEIGAGEAGWHWAEG